MDLRYIADNIVEVDELAIGNGRWERIKIGVYDEAETEAFLGREFHGFLGNGFLWFVREKCSLSLDYPNRVFWFSSPDQLTAPISSVPIAIENYYTVVTADVQDSGPYRFLLDTGASRTLVSPELANVLELPRGKDRPSRGVGFVLNGYESRLQSVRIGNAVASGLEVTVVDSSRASSYVESPVCGCIGTSFLQDFTIRFDYKDSAVVLI